MRQVFTRIGKAICLILLFVSLAAVFAEDWLVRSWADLSADEVIFHTKVSLEGSNPQMIKEVLLVYVSRGVLIFYLLILLFWLLRKKLPVLYNLRYPIWLFLSLCILGFSIARLETSSKLPGTIARWLLVSEDDTDFVAQHYTEPRESILHFPEQKRNLIYIFLESTEVTFTDRQSGGAFEQNCLPELTKLAKENECFAGNSGMIAGATSLEGSIWTMGAIFAQTSGLPLQVSPFSGMLDTDGGFFPKAVTMGDILKDAGYRQSFLLGSKAGFGGRESYFRHHGDFEIKDYDWAVRERKIPQDYYVWWGFEDEKLFTLAKEEIEAASREDTPFCITMLTVDTHFPDGYLEENSEKPFGDDQYANVFASEDQRVAELIEWLKSRGLYENTTIVLAGDHPTMDADFCDNVDRSYDRSVYVSVINGAQSPKKLTRRRYSTMDLFPTTLAALGVSIEGERLGLGTNLYSEKPTLIEEFGIDTCNRELSKPSLFLQSLTQH